MVTFLLFAGLLVGFLLVLRLGAMWGERKGPQPETRGSTTIESAVFALVAFFIAFSFSSAQTRLEGRTRLLIEEANSLSTAYLRLDLCNPDDQPRLKVRGLADRWNSAPSRYKCGTTTVERSRVGGQRNLEAQHKRHEGQRSRANACGWGN